MQPSKTSKTPRIPLRQQMLRVFSYVMVVFSIALALVVDENIRTNATQAMVRQNNQDAMFFANLLDNDMDAELSAIQSRADNMHELGLDKDLPRLERALNNLKRSKPRYSWIGYTDLQGTVLAASEGMLRGVDVSKRPWFQLGRQKPATVDVHDAVLLSKMLAPEASHPLRFVDVVAPVKDKSGAIVGVLGAHLSVDWLSQQMAFYANSLLHDSEYQPSVVGEDGQVRFGHALEPALIEKIRAVTQNSHAETHVLRHTSASEGELIVSLAQHRGSQIAANIGWTTVITVPQAVVNARILSTRLSALAGIGAAALVAWLTLWWLLRIAGQPVRILMDEIQKSRESHQPLALHPGLPQEFADITHSINAFIVSIQSRQTLLEQALIDMRDSFTGVTESFPGVLFKVEERGEMNFEFTYLSPSAQHYLNVDMTVLPISTQAFYDAVNPAVRDRLQHELRAQALNSQDIDINLPITGRDGVERQMRVRGRMRPHPAGQRAWDGVIVDVSDIVEAQRQAAAADSAKSKFLATMSHEIRTPLNGILGFAQILLGEVATEQQKADVRKIIDTSETLTRILNDILDFSKIEEGKLLLESRPFSVAELIESSVSLFHVEAKHRQIDFSVNMALAHELRMLGDPTRLRQILNNLLSNAFKFTSVGSVRLGVSVEAVQDRKSVLRITVSDTGIGMTAEQMQRLFQRFEQSDASIFRRFGGSGLGLAIVKGLLDSMGGHIAVDSSPQQGTRFTLELALPVLEGGAAAPEAAPERVSRPLNVLVVDDVAMNRELIGRFLQKQGHAFDEAEDGRQAIERATAQAYDLILMDIDMPVCNGLEAARAIRAQAGPSQHSAIIALTGYAFEKDVAQVLDAGMNAHLAKPINFKKLRELINDTVAP